MSKSVKSLAKKLLIFFIKKGVVPVADLNNKRHPMIFERKSNI